MKIGILGTGAVGQSLGTGFANLGHEVMMGSRDPRNPKALSWASKAGTKNFSGKVVMDITNPLLVGGPGNPPGLALGHTDSGGEQVQRWLPGARVVKVFNIIGSAFMVNPQFPGGPPDMFFCGNDAAAKKTVGEICKNFGWPAVDIGGIEGARLLEPMCILWVVYGMRTGSWDHAFKLLKK